MASHYPHCAVAHARSDSAGQLAAIHRVMAVVEFDMQGRILTANQNFLDLFGCRLEDIRGQYHGIFSVNSVAEDADYRELWERLGRGEYETGEYRRLASDGREVWLQASYNPIFDGNGKPYKVVEFASDVSYHHEVESALLEAKERAERAAASKSTFLANMSHEIRTPMNAIIGFTELLLDSPLDDMQRRHLRTVQHSARSLLTLLNDILDMAKLERGVVELEEIDFSLRELVELTCALLSPNAQAKGLQLTFDYAPELGECFRGDPLRLQQVLLNLLGNAIKFTERGSVRLQLFAEGGQVQLVVHDTGIGICADRLERIFEPFAQADASMSRRFGGTGLGTSIARQLVELMGGSIEVVSQPGVGSSFRVRLALPSAPALPAPQEAVLLQLPPLRILVVDDMAQSVELLALGLGRLGHHVSTAGDGAAALQILHDSRFDVVLMDVRMPGADGLEVTRQLRREEQLGGRPRTPVIALTAGVLQRDRQAARAAGMDGFAPKPVVPGQLLAEIARVTGLAAGLEDVGAAPLEEGGALWDARLLCAPTGGFAGDSDDLLRAMASPSPRLTRRDLRHGGNDQSAVRHDKVIRVQLEELLAVLQRGELDDWMRRQLAASLEGCGQGERMIALERAINNFDFDQAAGLLHELLAWLDTLPEVQTA